MSGPEGFDYGSESEKLGGVPGVLRLKDGDEKELIVTGPMKECLDRFGSNNPTTKYVLGVYNLTDHTRHAVVLSWKAKTQWDDENKKRPFSKNVVRYGRAGATRENTKYNVVSIRPFTPAEVEELKRSAPLDVAGVAAELTRRAQLPPAAGAAPAAPAATTAQGAASYPHPGNTAAPASSSPTATPATAAAYVKSLTDAKAALAGGFADVPKLSEAVRQTLLAALGKDKVVQIRNDVGGQPGVGLTADQLGKAIDKAISILAFAPAPVAAAVPAGGMAAAMGVSDDDLPF